MKYVMNRNITITSRIGHTLRFVKGEPLHVPPAMVEAVMQRGALPEDGEAPETPEEKAPPQVKRGTEREVALMDAIKTMTARNTRGDFTASGLPHAKVMEQIVGFQVTSEERNTVWKKLQAELETSKSGLVDVA